MNASDLIRRASIVVVSAVVACASAADHGFREFADPRVLERTESGCRMRVDGVFEITAPVAIWTDDGIVFESNGSRRDVVFTDRLAPDGSAPEGKRARVEFYVAFTAEELARGPSPAAVDERMDTLDVSGQPFRPIAANHVRVRKDGRDRWLVEVVDTEITGEPHPDTTCRMRFDYAAARK